MPADLIEATPERNGLLEWILASPMIVFLLWAWVDLFAWLSPIPWYWLDALVGTAVFALLMKLKNHHLAKLENRGRAINFERLIGEIMSGINEFPAQLSLSDQGRFAVGYYHQRQDFFTAKENKNNN